MFASISQNTDAFSLMKVTVAANVLNLARLLTGSSTKAECLKSQEKKPQLFFSIESNNRDIVGKRYLQIF